MVEVVQGAERRLDRGVAAGSRADRVRAARIVRAGHQAVVRALAVGRADRVDRRHVERRRSPSRRSPGAGPRPRGTSRCGRVGPLRAREDLVPGGEARPLAIDLHLELAVVAGDDGRIDVARSQIDQDRIERELAAPRQLRLRVADRRRRPRAASRARRRRRISASRASSREPSSRSLETSWPCFGLLLRVGGPGAVEIGERLDGVGVQPELGQLERATPTIVVPECQRRRLPGLHRSAPDTESGRRGRRGPL